MAKPAPSSQGRVLGLDVGTKTIGVALSDELRVAAHPHTVIRRSGHARDIAEVAGLVKDQKVAAVVVGLPLALDGREGARARRVRAFAEALAGLGADVHLWDERFSTSEAERVLVAADVSRARRKAVIDKQAAAVILQGWLDRQRAAAEAAAEDEPEDNEP